MVAGRLAGSESCLGETGPPLVPPKLRPLVPLVPPKQNINKSQDDITRINQVGGCWLISRLRTSINILSRRSRKFPVAMVLTEFPV